MRQPRRTLLAALALLLVGGSLQARMPQRPRPRVAVPTRLSLRAASALVQDQRTGEWLVQKHADAPLPIASLTKLMTAMVLLDSLADLDRVITIEEADKDTLRHSRSRLPVGTRLTLREALQLALMASENRAAHALARTSPGGMAGFVAEMNAKARSLGLDTVRFEDPTGLSGDNVASAKDLAQMVDQAHRYPLIRRLSTAPRLTVRSGRRLVEFHNTNSLTYNRRWDIGLSKTGYIEESGPCLVMQAKLAQRPVLIVLLDAVGSRSRFADADRIKRWLER